MCIARVWNKIYSKEIEKDSHSTFVYLIAERSDYEVFMAKIKLDGNDSLLSISEKIKKGIEVLESYRNCDCSVKSGTCIKHTTEINTGIPIPSAQTASFKFGRRSG